MSDDHQTRPDRHGPVRTWPALDVHGLAPASDEADVSTQPASARRDLLEAALTDFDVTAIQETSPTSWRVFFITPGGRDTAASTLPREFPALTFASLDVPDDDWAARSQASLTAVCVGRIIVSPPWAVEDAIAESGPAQPPLVLVIQPSMGFGTGHHATTRLCLAALQGIPLQGRTVIDVGTGSGVLAIAASLLGASDVVGLDDDTDAIQAARENLDLNPAARVTLDIADVRASAARTADVVLANLTGGLLLSAASRIRGLVAPDGTLILSGLMEPEEHDVLAAFDRHTVVSRQQEDEWLCLTLAAPA